MPDQSSAATEHAILQEITAPLDHLPDDPVAAVHADFPAALRGYDRLAVDAYVRQTSQLVAELQASRSPEAAVRRALERVGEQISGILQRAHDTAEQITSQSRSEAEDRLEHARIEAVEIVAAAHQKVKDLDADTDRIWIERHRIVDDARELASQLTALAEAAAERFPEETQDEEPPAHAAPAASAPAASAAEEPAGGPGQAEAEEAELYPEDEETNVYDEHEEIEATRAFEPLDRDPDVDADRPERPTGSHSAIPPASQAANRRASS